VSRLKNKPRVQFLSVVRFYIYCVVVVMRLSWHLGYSGPIAPDLFSLNFLVPSFLQANNALRHTCVHLNYQIILPSVKNLCLLKNDSCCMQGRSNFVTL
jgi:hypothetical protein